jgi:hypothetical protein
LDAGWNLIPYPYAERYHTTAQIEADLIANCPDYVPGSLSIFDSSSPYYLGVPDGTEQIANEEGLWLQVSSSTTWQVFNY